MDASEEFPDLDSSDEDLPDVRQLLADDKKKREQADARRKLQAAKLQYLSKQAETTADGDDSDLEVVYDDMHAVAEEEDKERRARKAKHITESVGRQHQLTYAGKAKAIRSPTKATPLRGSKKDFDILAAAAAPSFSVEARSKTRKGKEREGAKIGPGDLNRMLLHASEKQSRELTAQKEAEFYKKAGQRRDALPEVNKMDVLKTLALKGMENAARDVSDDGDDEGQDDESDGDWTPDYAQQVPPDEEEGAGEASQELPVATDEDDQDYVKNHNENDENVPVKARRSTTRSRAVIESDDEGGDIENMAPPTGRVLVAGSSLVLGASPGLGLPLLGLHHRGSISSIEERLEDGTDKENDCRLMFDRGEDKENTAIASQSSSVVVSPLAPLRGGGSFFTMSQSFTRTASSSSNTGGDTTLMSDERAPFKELSTGDDEEDMFFSPSNRPHLLSGADATPSRSPFGAKSLSPLELRSGGKGLGAFFNDGEASDTEGDAKDVPCSLQPAAIIQPGLSQFFEATAKDNVAVSPAPIHLGKAAGFTQFLTPAKVPLMLVMCISLN